MSWKNYNSSEPKHRARSLAYARTARLRSLVPVVGSYIDGDRYAVFDVEYILYNVGLVNYKDNNEGTYKVIWPYAVFGEKLDKRKPGKLSDILGLPV